MKVIGLFRTRPTTGIGCSISWDRSTETFKVTLDKPLTDYIVVATCQSEAPRGSHSSAVWHRLSDTEFLVSGSHGRDLLSINGLVYDLAAEKKED